MNLHGKTLFITGASRGIGLAIALRAARDGANVAIAAKTVEAQPNLPGTIYTAAQEVDAAGGRGLALMCDIRFEDQVQAAVQKTIEAFGGIDICVNNASALGLTGTLATTMKRYDLMNAINARGTFLTSKTCIPHLQKSGNPHILSISPPLDMQAKWFAPHVAYSLAKFGMSICALGMAQEFRADGIAVNCLWPRTTIDTAAVRNLLGGEAVTSHSRSPHIMGDAAHWIFTQPARECTGNFFIDDVIVEDNAIADLASYSVTPGAKLIEDFFVPEGTRPLSGVALASG